MKPINTSIYDFPTLVQTYVYVDKTAQIYELAKPGADILQRVTLRIPNREVADSFYDGYIAQVFGTDFEIDDFEDDAEKIR